MKASEWIDEIKNARGWDSDYRVAKELGVSRATVSAYRSRTPTLDEETSLKVAELLGREPALLLIDQVVERTKNEGVKNSMVNFLRNHGFNWPLDFNTGRPLTGAEIEFREKRPGERWTAAMRLANRELGFDAPLEAVLAESTRYKNGRLLNKVNRVMGVATMALISAATLGMAPTPSYAASGQSVHYVKL